jgi:hypothetical protein
VLFRVSYVCRRENRALPLCVMHAKMQNKMIILDPASETGCWGGVVCKYPQFQGWCVGGWGEVEFLTGIFSGLAGGVPEWYGGTAPAARVSGMRC